MDEQLGSIEALEKLFATVEESKIRDIFGYMSEMSIEDAYLAMQYVKAASQLYFAANEYGPNVPACPHGSSVHVSRILPTVDSRFVDALCDHELRITDRITDNNISEVVKAIGKKLAEEFIKDGELDRYFEDFMEGNPLVPTEIITPKQKFYAAVNKAIRAELYKALPDLERLPTPEEYGRLLSDIRVDQSIKAAMEEYNKNATTSIAEETKTKVQKMQEKRKAQEDKAFWEEVVDGLEMLFQLEEIGEIFDVWHFSEEA